MNNETQTIKKGFNLSKLKKENQVILAPDEFKNTGILQQSNPIVSDNKKQEVIKEKKKVGRKALKEEDKKEYKAVCYLTLKDSASLQEIANEEEEGDLSKLFRKVIKNYLKSLNKI